MDRIEHEICAILQNNARLSNKELAAEVGLSPSSCHERVKKLWERGVLTGVHASISPEAFGINLEAVVQIRLSRHVRDDVEGFIAHLDKLKEVLAYYHVTGEFDYIVHVAVKNQDHLRDFALDAFTAREEVSQILTSLVFQSKIQKSMPCFLDF
jgi:DNA-binding Lrp family transcriptional regulator|tara:strand:+ start:66 stop:527 length:462 start_codon:yes stop_codon:yes gene_type:complete